MSTAGVQSPIALKPVPRPVRPAAPKIDNIPDDLKARAQWVVWKFELRGEKWTKIPYQTHSPGQKAKADVPSTWAGFDVAWAVYLAGGFDGIGYEFAVDDPYFGVDVDDCLRAGVVMPWAESHVHALLASYGEVSPSGKGLKFIARGKLPSDRGTRREALGPHGTGALELYDHGRFFTITGDVFGSSGTIADLPDVAVSLYGVAKPAVKSKKSKSGGNGQYVPRNGSPGLSVSDQDVLDAMGRSKVAPKIRTLWVGRWQGWYASQSSADQALCNYLAFYCGKGNEAQVERLFLQSKLGQRDKVTKRADYLRRTVDFAYSGRSDFYDWPVKKDRMFSNSKLVKVKDKNGKDQEVLSSLRIEEISERLMTFASGWPKRVEETLFIGSGDHQPVYLSSPQRLFAWVDTFAKVDWTKGSRFITQERFYEHLRMTAKQFDAIETLPHWPAIPGIYYLHQELPAAGRKLESLLSFFEPASPLDRELIKTLILTLFWGGSPGSRPAFLVTGPDQDQGQGRGVGKSALCQILSEELAGGFLEVSPTDSIAEVKTRLLSTESGRRRVVRLDNLKTFKFSWADLEGLLTSSTISGKALYVGEGRRPNTLVWMITLNGATLSKDMAQRCIQIKLERPTFKASWETEVREFIRSNRWGLLADIRALLEADSQLLHAETRWASWERDVLGKTFGWGMIQTEIVKRQKAVDDDDDERSHVAQFFVERLEERGHFADSETVRIPSLIAAEWVSDATRTKLPTNRASAFIRGLSIPQLRPSRTGGRGWVWTGANSKDKQARVLNDPPVWKSQPDKQASY